jgi:hypothetical protein
VAWLYVAALCVCDLVYALLTPGQRTALIGFASTSVHNLSRDPVGSLVVSAFFQTGYLSVWPILAAVALFGTCHALGNWRTALTCAAGHVVGTLVSEGIVACRLASHALPAADRYLTDVGPSYVVMSALAICILYGTWLVRAAAAIELVLLALAGAMFAGLTSLNVSAVGHLTALATGVLAGSLLAWQRPRQGARPPPPIRSATSSRSGPDPGT